MARERIPRVVSFAAVAVVVAYFVAEVLVLSRHPGAGLGFPLDDSWIHLQFARNLALGLGLSYNPGELVTGSTAPLWTALLALLFHLPGNVVLWVKLAGSAAFVGAVRASWRLGRGVGLPVRWATFAALLVAGTYWLVWSALSGMEITLFLWLATEGMVLHLEELRDGGRPAISLPVLALSGLARPEGFLLLALAVFDRALAATHGSRPPATGHRARALGAGLLAAALVALPTLGFYWWVGGSPLPTTFGAKAGALRDLLPNGQYLFMVFGVLFRPQPWMALAAGGGIVALVSRRRGAGPVGLLPALWVVALPLAYSLLAPQGKHLLLGNFGRYFFPLFPSVVVLGCLGVAPLFGAQAARPLARLGARLFFGFGLAALVAPTLYTFVQGAGFYARNVANVDDGDVRMGRWLAEHLPPEAVVAVQDIGAIKFFAPQRVLDLAGIVSPEIQRLIRGAETAEDPFGQAGMRRFLDQHRPDYLVAFPSWYPALVAPGSGFEPVFVLAVPDNITLAGDRLVVYRTPWTRMPPRERAPQGDPTP